ncbi:hypothetical protein RB195_014961 [Necator americanus]
MQQKKRLPESGIYTEDGYLFHHSSAQSLNREEIERLREHDILYEHRSRFTPAEDEQIRKNWKRFASKHNLSYELAPHYAGVPGHKIFTDNEERMIFNRNTALWPNLCRNLPHRSACQVRRRIGVIFDTAILDGQADIPYSKNVAWTRKETRKLLRYYRSFGMSAYAMVQIGKLLKRPAHSCQNHLRSVLTRVGPVPDHLRKKLWILVMKYCKEKDKSFERTVRKAIYQNNYEVIKEHQADTPWTIIAQRMVFSVEVVKDSWLCLLKDLQEQFNQQQEREPSTARKEAWCGALKAVLDAVSPISCEDYSVFLNILSEETPEDITYDVLNRKLYDCGAISAKLEEIGIVGFYCGGVTELNYLFRKTRKILWRLHRLAFRRLKLPYTLKERIHILSLAYDYQCEILPDDVGDEAKSSSSHAEEKRMATPQRRRFKDLNLKHRGFPVLHREPFVEALVVYSLNHFDDWIPPTAFKKYVVSEEVLAMFPEKRDNSELIKQSDVEAAVSYLDLDPCSNESSPECEQIMPCDENGSMKTRSPKRIVEFEGRKLRNVELTMTNFLDQDKSEQTAKTRYS